ncbi:MAG: NusG domain II-containing protein [Eubacterium sp.]|nr:NusG domain II-containing protein [Eubacterium sp.]
MRRNGSDSTKQLKKNDLYLILAALILAVIAFAYVKFTAKSGKMAVVRVDGVVKGSYDLSHDRVIRISGPEGLLDELSEDSPGDSEDDDSRRDADDQGKDRPVVNTGDGWENILKIEDGRVSMVKADCPDKICVDHKPIRNVGETIVCLPHKLVVEIIDEGGVEQTDFDVIAR